MIPTEGQTIEWKESPGEHREIVQTCAAFATAQGGRIYIGVRDHGHVVGVQIGRGTLESLANDIAQNTVPKLVPAIQTIQESGQTVVVVEGDIIQQVEDAMAFVRRNTSMGAKIDEGALERKEQWEYPLDAVREGITNAVCHRDYADSGNVLVKIFDDRLEVSNPGGLPVGLTVEDLKNPHESRPRNKLVADAFFLIKYIEQFGTGIGRMFEECRRAGVPEPQFQCRVDAFRIVFNRPVSPEKVLSQLRLSSRQAAALKHAIAQGKLTRPDYEKIVRVPRATANRDLAELVERGILKKRGAARATWYEFIFPGNEKIRETIIPSELGGKPPLETKREKIVSRKPPAK